MRLTKNEKYNVVEALRRSAAADRRRVEQLRGCTQPDDAVYERIAELGLWAEETERLADKCQKGWGT